MNQNKSLNLIKKDFNKVRMSYKIINHKKKLFKSIQGDRYGYRSS